MKLNEYQKRALLVVLTIIGIDEAIIFIIKSTWAIIPAVIMLIIGIQVIIRWIK